MPHVVPSDVVTFIDRAFPTAASEGEGTGPLTLTESNLLSEITIGRFETLLELTDQVPDRLLVLDSSCFAEFVVARATIRSGVAGYRRAALADRGTRMPLRSLNRVPAVAALRREMAKCPDQAPSPRASGLDFISDVEYRDSLRVDLSTITNALAHDEWKPATVLSGSVIEALLLWALKARTHVDLRVAVDAVDSQRLFSPRKKPDIGELDRWDLVDYILVAKELKEIGEDAATIANKVRDFRNLIHPGRSVRLGQTCTKGTAQVAYGALEMVVENLATKHP
jgi:hypothetical protein